MSFRDKEGVSGADRIDVKEGDTEIILVDLRSLQGQQETRPAAERTFSRQPVRRARRTFLAGSSWATMPQKAQSSSLSPASSLCSTCSREEVAADAGPSGAPDDGDGC